MVYTDVELEWDEAKRLANLAKHGLDFSRLRDMLQLPCVTRDSEYPGEEPRSLYTGKIDGMVVTAIVTVREDKIRVISLRRARDEEKRRYSQLYT